MSRSDEVLSLSLWEIGNSKRFLHLHIRQLGRMAAAFGVLVTVMMVFAKVLPFIPGHFTVYEWIALAIWGTLGVAISAPFQFQARKIPAKEAVPSRV